MSDLILEWDRLHAKGAGLCEMAGRTWRFKVLEMVERVRALEVADGRGRSTRMKESREILTKRQSSRLVMRVDIERLIECHCCNMIGQIPDTRRSNIRFRLIDWISIISRSFPVEQTMWPRTK